MGQGNQERFDLYARKIYVHGKYALQNGPALNQAAGTGFAFLVALFVLQNLLAVLKLPDLLQDVYKRQGLLFPGKDFFANGLVFRQPFKEGVPAPLYLGQFPHESAFCSLCPW